MFLLRLVPPVVGYVLLGPVYGAASRTERAAFGAALGLSLHLATLNVTWRLLEPATAALAGTLLLAALGIAARLTWGGEAAVGGGWRPGTVEICLLAVALAAVLANTLMWQLVFRDDDLAVHYPLLGNIVRGEVALRNPHFPELPYTGHYAKNLLVALLSTLTPLSPFDFQVLFIPVLHTLTTWVFYALLRVHGMSALVASTTTLFAWMAAEMELRTGMLETFQNNNSLVYFLFFAIAHFLLRTLELRTLRAALVTGVVLGTYQLVYETHFGILLLAFLGTAAWHLLRGGRAADADPDRRGAAAGGGGDGRLVGAVLVVTLLAGGLALVEGGALTEFASRWARGAEPRSEDIVGLSQEVNVGFPKWPPRITSYYGHDYSPFSRRLLVECGPFVLLLPPLLAFFLWRGRSFPVPLTEWARGPLSGFVREVLEGGRLAHRPWMRGRGDVPDEDRTGRGSWALLSLELWYQTFHDRARHYRDLLRQARERCLPEATGHGEATLATGGARLVRGSGA